jgi:hypothetical protein
MSDIERQRRPEPLPATHITPPLPTADQRTYDWDQTPSLTRHDRRLDQRAESRHILTVRGVQRRAIEAAAVKTGQTFADAAAIEAQRRVLSEAKFQLQRAQKESQILAGDDLELAAKFAQLDDDYFSFVRRTGMA